MSNEEVDYGQVDNHRYVPYDGALILAANDEDLSTLQNALWKKNLYVCSAKVVTDVTSDHVALCQSFLRLQKEFVMLIGWKITVDPTIAELAKEKNCPFVHSTDEIQVLVELIKKEHEALKKMYKQAWVNWIQLPNSPASLTVWHKLNTKAIGQLSKDGCTHIVTLLSEKEKPENIKKVCGEKSIAWKWIPIQGAALNTLQQNIQLLSDAIKDVVPLLDTSAKILVHCSAGVHRTGTFTYALLRSKGFSPDEAKDLLYQIRPVTARGVGEDRLNFVETKLLNL